MYLLPRGVMDTVSPRPLCPCPPVRGGVLRPGGRSPAAPPSFTLAVRLYDVGFGLLGTTVPPCLAQAYWASLTPV